MLVQKILDTVTDIYHDPDYDRIPLTTYLSYITDAVNTVILVRPDAHVMHEDFTLITGNEQTLPDGGNRIIDVQYNLPSYSPVVKVDRMIMDNSYPTWMADSGDEVYNFMIDSTMPKKFYVYPKVTAGKQVRLVYSKTIPLITDVSEVLDIEEIFFTPIIDIVMAMLYRIDSESSEVSVNKANFHANVAFNALGVELKNGLDISPAGGK